MVEKVVSLGCSSDTNQSDLQLHLARITSRGTEGPRRPNYAAAAATAPPCPTLGRLRRRRQRQGCQRFF